MELPYDLENDRLSLDPISHERLQRGDLSSGEVMAELVTWDPEEIDRVLWGAGVLIAKHLENWCDMIHGRNATDFVLMALDTAMIWERG